MLYVLIEEVVEEADESLEGRVGAVRKALTWFVGGEGGEGWREEGMVSAYDVAARVCLWGRINLYLKLNPHLLD